MLNTLGGMLSAADAILYMDNLATYAKNNASRFGQNANGETGTIAADANLIRKVILGDGTTTYPGLSSDGMKGKSRSGLNGLVFGSRYDTEFARLMQQLIPPLDSMVTENLPSGWVMASQTIPHAFDTYLLRMNGTASPYAGTPPAGATAALTLATDYTGRMPECATTVRPYISHTFVGDDDWEESLPSTEVQGATITHADGGLTYTIASPATVPSGVYKLRLYRSLYSAGAAATKYYQKEYDTTPGAAWPTMRLLEGDEELTKLSPPSWFQCAAVAEFALEFALAYGSAQSNTGVPGINTEVLLSLNSTGMLSPQNVLLVPSNALLGLGNEDQHGNFGVYTVGTGWVTGTILTTNNATGRSQGFAGAYGTGSNGLRCRATTALNNAGTVTISYTYYDAANGWGNAQTATGLVSAAFTGTASGSTATFSIPAGRIVRTVTVTATTVTTSGVWLIEAAYPRTY